MTRSACACGMEHSLHEGGARLWRVASRRGVGADGDDNANIRRRRAKSAQPDDERSDERVAMIEIVWMMHVCTRGDTQYYLR